MSEEWDARTGEAEVVRAVFDSLPLIAIGLTGPRHRVDAVNQTYRAAFAREKVVGMSIVDVFPEVVGQQVFEALDRVFATGVPQALHGWRVQIENPESGGMEEHYVDMTFAPRLDASGAVVGVNAFGVDTTEQERERRQARQETAAAVLRYERARDVITALQRQLLPAGLPVLPSVQVAASYLLADVEDAAGGDWFDAVPVPGGRVALVVGDVVGTAWRPRPRWDSCGR